MTRSFLPFPWRTVTCPCSRSKSLTRSSSASRRRRPPPYSRPTTRLSGAFQAPEYGRHFCPRQDDGEALSSAGANHAIGDVDVPAKHDSVQEQDRAQRLILSRRADVTFGRQRREKRCDVIWPEGLRVTHPMEADVTSDPAGVGLLGSPTVAPKPDRTTYLLHEFRRCWLVLHTNS